MKNVPRTTLLSVIAVAAAMLLGPDARAQSMSPPKDYLKFLLGLPEANQGMSLMQRYSSVQRSINMLQHIPMPGPRIVSRLAALSSQEMKVFTSIQSNINALLARETVLQAKYQSLEGQKAALLAAGRIFQARQVGIQEGNVSNVLNSVQHLVVTERSVATPVR